ncbi:putative membrane protein YeaQ/YmgE (transglycosylase-associated protein family) [Rhodobium orientis]|uniref:GlsB/YeaQ/YmgE family stress response membrane protein n=1 Tax=Rhodobium orientis TaxID=34017 RepID=A0A327JZV1_9HYPH|nr:GlsB/YeaQ/YmgE family stress response membrane protein [Rhodobium orientis]MBB4302462.1 putative membrane protein YeaQ/YmgE (transglycosylase-associated protein family) [Rhodobium orientis]MBK5949311.1 GlsB/YeaQ/YmgE family stress response membrane protein [Rhodobium orientis]RAI28638.1 GlsB/YeaQ/YmgE family stress response membrane protein [Rhodobium orientis]
MDTRSIIIWIVIGLIAGWLASFVVGGGGLLKYILWGLVGSFVGGFLARQFNISLNIGNAFVEQIIVATVGAIVVVLIARLIS